MKKETPTAAEVLAAIEKAETHVHDLAAGTKKWQMRVPVDERDSDMILCAALVKARDFVKAIRDA